MNYFTTFISIIFEAKLYEEKARKYIISSRVQSVMVDEHVRIDAIANIKKTTFEIRSVVNLGAFCIPTYKW